MQLFKLKYALRSHDRPLLLVSGGGRPARPYLDPPVLELRYFDRASLVVSLRNFTRIVFSVTLRLRNGPLSQITGYKKFLYILENLIAESQFLL